MVIKDVDKAVVVVVKAVPLLVREVVVVVDLAKLAKPPLAPSIPFLSGSSGTPSSYHHLLTATLLRSSMNSKNTVTGVATVPSGQPTLVPVVLG